MGDETAEVVQTLTRINVTLTHFTFTFFIYHQLTSFLHGVSLFLTDLNCWFTSFFYRHLWHLVHVSLDFQQSINQNQVSSLLSFVSMNGEGGGEGGWGLNWFCSHHPGGFRWSVLTTVGSTVKTKQKLVIHDYCWVKIKTEERNQIMWTARKRFFFKSKSVIRFSFYLLQSCWGMLKTFLLLLILHVCAADAQKPFNL